MRRSPSVPDDSARHIPRSIERFDESTAHSRDQKEVKQPERDRRLRYIKQALAGEYTCLVVRESGELEARD